MSKGNFPLQKFNQFLCLVSEIYFYSYMILIERVSPATTLSFRIKFISTCKDNYVNILWFYLLHQFVYYFLSLLVVTRIAEKEKRRGKFHLIVRPLASSHQSTPVDEWSEFDKSPAHSMTQSCSTVNV